MSGRDAPQILYELVHEPTLARRRELHEEFIEALHAEEDHHWIAGQQRLLEVQRKRRSADLVKARAAKKPRKTARRKNCEREARNIWKTNTTASVNVVADALCKSFGVPVRTVTRWIAPLRPRT